MSDGSSPGSGRRCAAPDAGRTRPARVSIRLATAGLVVVLFVLTAFSVTVAVTNARAAEDAQASAAVSDASERALEALLAQEEAAEEVVAAVDDAETRAEYDAADALTRTTLEALYPRAAGARDAAGAERLRDHADYGTAVQRMFEVAARDEELAEPFEDEFVDPPFDRLALALDGVVSEQFATAREALSAIGRAQQLLLVATPVLFGVGMVLFVGFTVMLRRSRREVGLQADENRFLSLHDALTGLPNRTLLRQRAESALVAATRSRTPIALMLLDLDRFKEINDTLGHHHGDLVLQATARLLEDSVRSTDTVARLGGDEFAILLPDLVGAADALQVAAKVQRALEDSLDVDGVTLDVDASIGLVLSGEHGDDVATLLQHADIAMYRAKDRDLGVCVYDPELNGHSREQLGLLGELRRALDSDELVLWFQPKIDLHDRSFTGAEALLRWQHPTRGLVPPGAFLPAAERTALIRPLTRWVLDAALAECQRWKDRGQVLRVAVNVSARNLLDADFADDVLGLLARWGLPASCLVLEVTESAIMLDPDRAEEILSRFAGRGIELSIDDFGAGYTSLAHLRTLPVKELKIDRSLVARMAVSDGDAVIVSSVVDMVHRLGLRTVAEGVEDEATLERLTQMGCDVAQGFHIARPMPAAELNRWCADRAARTADARRLADV